MGEGKKNKWYENPMHWGKYLTILIAALLFFFGFSPYCETINEAMVCTNKYQKFWRSSPNEIGDTLAGIAGAFAFLWIVITVMLQGQELKAQREELKLNRKESEKMASALEAQVSLLKYERELREEERAIAALHEKLDLTARQISFYQNRMKILFIKPEGPPIKSEAITQTSSGNRRYSLFGSKKITNLPILDFYTEYARQLNSISNGIEKDIKNHTIKRKLIHRGNFDQIQSTLNQIREKHADPTDRIKTILIRCRMRTISERLTKISEMDIWDESDSKK